MRRPTSKGWLGSPAKQPVETFKLAAVVRASKQNLGPQFETVEMGLAAKRKPFRKTALVDASHLCAAARVPVRALGKPAFDR